MAAAAQAKLKQAPAANGEAPISLMAKVEALRKRDPKSCRPRPNGFTPVPHIHALDRNRLCGQSTAKLHCIDYIWAQTLGADRDPKTKPPEWSRPLTALEFLWYASGGDKGMESPIEIRTIELALEDLVAREVIIQEKFQGVRGAYTYAIPVETWVDLASYVERKPAASAEELDSEPDGEESEEALPERNEIRFQRTPTPYGKPSTWIETDGAFVEKFRVLKTQFADVRTPAVEGRIVDCQMEIQPIWPKYLEQYIQQDQPVKLKTKSVSFSKADQKARNLLREVMQRAYRGLGPLPDPILDQLRTIQNGTPLDAFARKLQGKQARDWAHVIALAGGKKMQEPNADPDFEPLRKALDSEFAEDMGSAIPSRVFNLAVAALGQAEPGDLMARARKRCRQILKQHGDLSWGLLIGFAEDAASIAAKRAQSNTPAAAKEFSPEETDQVWQEFFTNHSEKDIRDAIKTDMSMRKDLERLFPDHPALKGSA